MIITCNECSTNFNLDDSLVRENGSKVRCSVCKTVFTAYPLPRETEQFRETEPDFSSESTPAFEDNHDFEMETNNFSFEENEFDLNDDTRNVDPEEKDFEFEIEDISGDIAADASDESTDTDFDGIEFEPMKDETEDSGLSMMTEDEPELNMEEDRADIKIEEETGFLEMDFEGGESPEKEDAQDDAITNEEEFELEFDVDGDPTDTPDPEELSLEMEHNPEDNEAPLSLESNDPEKELDEIMPEDDFSEYDAVLEQETEPEDTSADEEEVEEDAEEDLQKEEEPPLEKSVPLMDLPERSHRRKKKPLVSLPAFLLLLIFFLTAGAYIASIMTGYKIPYLSDVKIPFIEKYLKKATPVAELKPIPNENSVNGRFVSNTTGGTLFVITGRVDNPSNVSYSHIQVQGTLSTKDIPAAKTKAAFCGNVITEEMLKSGTVDEMMKLLEVKEGAHNSNMNIAPGGGVPFMIVFSDLPEKLQNFNVKVVGFEKAAAN